MARLHVSGYVLLIAGGTLLVAMLAPAFALIIAVVTTAWVGACVPSRLRRIVARSETTFRCSPERAFELLADPIQEPRYRTEIERIELLSPLPVRVGTLARGWVRIPRDAKLLGLHLMADEVVTEYDPPRTYGTQVRGEPAQTRLRFDAVGDVTRVMASYEDVMDFANAVTGGLLFRAYAQRKILESRRQGWDRARLILEQPAA